MKKPGHGIPAKTTGIYTTPPRHRVGFQDYKAVRAIWEAEERDIFDLNRLIGQAVTQAKAILAQYATHTPDTNTPHNVRELVECAEQVLRWEELFRRAEAHDDSEQLKLCAFWLGVRREELRIRASQSERFALSGRHHHQRMKSMQRRAWSAKTLHSPEDKPALQQRVLDDVTTQVQTDPSVPRTTLYLSVAKQHGISLRTLYRYLAEHRKKFNDIS